MSIECKTIHLLSNKLKRYSFPFDENKIPLNGIYILFQKGELSHGQDRIVRIGTHTGDNQLRSRLKQHFINENKDRSIFRKHIGRSFLKKNNDPFLQYWNIDLTSKAQREKYSSQIDFIYQKKLEKKVSKYIQENFSFCVFEVLSKEERIKFEKKIISTVSWCKDCCSTQNWLGNYSPNNKIVKSGLWLVNELFKTPFDSAGIDKLKQTMRKNNDIS
jgi:hypothetical protein